MIPKLAHELVDGFVDRGEVDLFTEYCDPMSVRSLQFMLGLDEVPWEDILRWNEGMMPGLANFEGDPEKQAPADRASAELGQAIERVLDRLRGARRLGALVDRRLEQSGNRGERIARLHRVNDFDSIRPQSSPGHPSRAPSGAPEQRLESSPRLALSLPSRSRARPSAPSLRAAPSASGRRPRAP